MIKIRLSKIKITVLSAALTVAAFGLFFASLRKYGTDITQIPSKLRTTLITVNFINAIAVVACGLYAVFYHNAKKKALKCSILLILIAIINIIISVTILVGDYPLIKPINLEYLDKVSQTVSTSEKKNDCDGIYYIGRQDCSPCQLFFRTLEKLTEKYYAHVFYYDTFEDRQRDAENMYRVLDQLSVDTVPYVFTVQDGSITNSFSGEAIEVDLRNYLSATQ